MLVSSLEPKVRSELLVSEGHDPASVVMQHQYWLTPLKLLVRFTSILDRSILVTVSFEFIIIILIDPFQGSPALKMEKPLNIIFYKTIRSRAYIIVVQHPFAGLYQDSLFMAPGSIFTPSRGHLILHSQKKSSCQKQQGLELRYLLLIISKWTSTKIAQIMAPPWGSLDFTQTYLQKKTLKTL